MRYNIGDILPNLSVIDAQNQTITLDEQMGDHGLMVIVLRGTWCPFCVGQIHTMRRRHPVYTKMGVNTLFVVPENHTSVWSFVISSLEPLPFVLHADEERTLTSDLVCIPDNPKVIQPLGVYVLNRERQVVWRLVGMDDDFPSHSKLEQVLRESLALTTHNH